MRAARLTMPGEPLVTHGSPSAQNLQADLGDGHSIFDRSPVEAMPGKPATARGDLSDLLTTTVTGFASQLVGDRHNTALRVPLEGPTRWGEQAFERLFDGCTALTPASGRVRLELSTSRFDQWTAWNWGRQGTAALADLPPGDWPCFVCIEPACVDRSVVQVLGNFFTSALQVRATTATTGQGAVP